MTYQLLEIKKLDRSPHNVRRTETKAALEELKASILAHGVLQNLVVVPAKKGKFHVVAGGRRLEALRELQAEGRLTGDHAVPCQVVEADDAAETSLAENVVRQAMHPADEFEAFAALVEQGKSAADVAARFGVTERHVQQRLRLGRVAPELLAAYRAGEMDLNCLMAYAVTDDQKRQMAVYRVLEGWQRGNPNAIRARLTQGTEHADSDLVKFVGLDAYKAAGGTVREDLFGEDLYLEDAALLAKLADDKLQATRAELEAEGWAWVEVALERDYRLTSLRRLHPDATTAPAGLLAEFEEAEAEQRRIAEAIDATEDDDELDALYQQSNAAEERVDAIGEKLEPYAAFTREQKAASGCYAFLNHQGAMEVIRGLVKPGAKQPTAAASGDTDGEPAAPAKKGMPESLKRDLEAYRLQAAMVEIASHPEIAFDLMAFTAANWTLRRMPVSDGPDIHFRDTHPRPSVERDTAAARRLNELREGLPLAWLESDGENERFAAFRALAQADKLRILAYCTAVTLKPKLGVDEYLSAYDTTLALTGGNVAAYWRPTKASYLSRITRDQLLEIGRRVMIGGDQWALRRKDAKKAALVDELHEAFARSHLPDTTDKVKEWLPEGMAFTVA